MTDRVFATAALALIAGVALVTSAARPTAPAGAAPPAPSIVYQPIAPSVFQPPKVVTAWATGQQEAAVTAHAAALWSGLTAMTDQRLLGNRLPVFDTWYSPCDVYPSFAGSTACTSLGPKPKTLELTARRQQHLVTLPALEQPHQFFDRHIVTTPGAIFANVRYNQEMADFVAPYADGSKLDALIGSSPAPANLPDPPTHAMMIKPVYQIVSGSEPTVLQVWRGPGLQVPPGSTSSTYVPSKATWTNVVVVVPDRWQGPIQPPKTVCTNLADANGNLYGSVSSPVSHVKVVKLSDFYTLPVSFAESQTLRSRALVYGTIRRKAQRLNAFAVPPGGPTLCPPPDYSKMRNLRRALVAMHVSSAEYPEVWTWQTFWYQPNLTSPLPGATGPFAHFDVATAYWTVDKTTNTNRHAFNPYLEAGFGRCVFATNSWPTPSSGGGDVPSPCPDNGQVTSPAPSPGAIGNMNLGRTTNCISCHSVATYVKGAEGNQPAQYVAHDSQPQVPLANSILARNLWSLVNNAGPSPTPTPAPKKP